MLLNLIHLYLFFMRIEKLVIKVDFFCWVYFPAIKHICISKKKSKTFLGTYIYVPLRREDLKKKFSRNFSLTTREGNSEGKIQESKSLEIQKM